MLRLALIAIAAALVVPGSALAAAPPRAYSPAVTPGSASWKVIGIPDLDQIRPLGDAVQPGLPGNGGNYCAPTASADLLAFLSAQGFRTGVDGTIDYAAPDGYDDAVTAIAGLGTAMSTDAANGTRMPDYTGELRRRLANAGVLRTVLVDSVRYHGGEELRSPTLREFTEVGLSGSLMLGTFGWYSQATASDGTTFLRRNGGHAVAMSSVLARRTAMTTGEIAFRDPWTNSTLDVAQTPYADDVHTVQDQTVTVAHPTTSVIAPITTVAMTDRANALVEGYVALSPQRVWVLDRNVLLRLTPEPFVPNDAPQERYDAGDGGIVDAILSPRTGLPTVLTGRGAIRRIGAGPGGKLGRLPVTTVATVRGATAIAEGRHGEVYTAAGATIVRITPDGQRATAKAPTGIIDLVATEAGLVGLGADGRRVITWNGDLKVVGQSTLKGKTTGLDLDPKGRAVPRAAKGLRDDAGRLVTLNGSTLAIGGKTAMKAVKAANGVVVAVDRSASIYDRRFYAKPFDTQTEQPTPPPPPLPQPQ